ncbi:hypothetical protein LTR94_030756, partial [Friedmanniomyces endolithicus]
RAGTATAAATRTRTRRLRAGRPAARNRGGRGAGAARAVLFRPAPARRGGDICRSGSGRGCGGRRRVRCLRAPPAVQAHAQHHADAHHRQLGGGAADAGGGRHHPVDHRAGAGAADRAVDRAGRTAADDRRQPDRAAQDGQWIGAVRGQRTDHQSLRHAPARPRHPRGPARFAGEDRVQLDDHAATALARAPCGDRLQLRTGGRAG